MPQQLIIYRRGEWRRYDTAYDEDQASAAMRRCVRRHGQSAQVRTVDADGWFAKHGEK